MRFKDRCVGWQRRCGLGDGRALSDLQVGTLDAFGVGAGKRQAGCFGCFFRLGGGQRNRPGRIYGFVAIDDPFQVAGLNVQ